MKNSTFWYDILKTRKNNQKLFGMISLQKAAFDKDFKRVLIAVFEDVQDPEKEETCICIKEEKSPSYVKMISVSVGENVGTSKTFHFWDCECEYLFNKFKEVFEEYGIGFVSEYNSKFKIGNIKINITQEQQFKDLM